MSVEYDECLRNGCRILRKTLARLAQRTAQDAVELFPGLLFRLYMPMPSKPITMASLQGACATK